MIAVLEAPQSVDSSSTKIGISTFTVASSIGVGAPARVGTTFYVIRQPIATRFARALVTSMSNRTPLPRSESLKEQVRAMEHVARVPDNWAESLASDLAGLSD